MDSASSIPGLLFCTQFKNLHLWLYGLHECLYKLRPCTSGKVQSIYRFKSNIWSHLVDLCWSPRLPDISGLMLKVEGMLHGGKHDPLPAVLRGAAAVKFKMTFFFLKVSHCLGLNIWYFSMSMKCGFMKFASDCICFAFAFYTPSLLIHTWVYRFACVQPNHFEILPSHRVMTYF